MTKIPRNSRKVRVFLIGIFVLVAGILFLPFNQVSAQSQESDQWQEDRDIVFEATVEEQRNLKGNANTIEPKTNGTLPYCDDMVVRPGAYVHLPRPALNHVKRVVIVVEGFKDDSLPAPLRKTNLQSILRDVYNSRYSPTKWCDTCSKNHCYNRTNPPVDIIPFETPDEKLKARELSLNPDVLTAYVQVEKISENTALVKIINYRPHIDQPFWREWLNIPQSFWDVDAKSPPLSYNSVYSFNTKETEEKLSKDLSSYFSGKLQ
ncbi:MAG: hypothetical protein LRY57_04545 [Alphaproteobacteria bacterium]|nr:hypothetical protein [Alphaproteobacteria bacterium]